MKAFAVLYKEWRYFWYLHDALTDNAGSVADAATAQTLPPALVTDSAPQNGLPVIAAGGDPDIDPVQRLRNLISERQEETVEILRGWMEEDEEVTG